MPNHDGINSINICHHTRFLLAGSQSSPDYLYVTLTERDTFFPISFAQPRHALLPEDFFTFSVLPLPKIFLHRVSPWGARPSPTPWITSLTSLFLRPSRATQVILQLRQCPPPPGAVDSVPASPVHTVPCTQVIHEQGSVTQHSWEMLNKVNTILVCFFNSNTFQISKC